MSRVRLYAAEFARARAFNEERSKRPSGVRSTKVGPADGEALQPINDDCWLQVLKFLEPVDICRLAKSSRALRRICDDVSTRLAGQEVPLKNLI